MRCLITLLTALILSAPALAADHELSFELGSIQNGDRSWNWFSNNNNMPSLGVRAGFAVHDRVALIAGWQRARRGRDLYADNTYIGRAAYFGNTFNLGAKVDLPLSDAFFPYVITSGLLVHSTMRFDDDPDDEDSIGQNSASGISPGFMGAFGVELRIPQSSAPFTFGTYIEVGYGLVANIDIDPYGDMQPKGLVIRGGLGVRF